MNPGRRCRGGREWPGFGGAGSQEDGRSLSRLSTVRATGENLSTVLDDRAGWGLGAGAGGCSPSAECGAHPGAILMESGGGYAS